MFILIFTATSIQIERGIQVANSGQGNPMLAWVIGLIIIAAVDSYIGYLFYVTGCQATGFAQIMVLVILPAVYLALMFLTLKKQP